MFRRIFVVVLLLALFVAGYEWLEFPDVSPLVSQMPKSTAFMDLRRQELRDAGQDDRLQYQPVPYEQISPFLRRGVLVAEDNAFYEHGGVDTAAMKEAIERDWKRRKMTHGGSTITQQLAKNLYLSPSRNPIRKVKEYFLARSLERHLTKKRILELYLNVVEMGERVYGAEAASQFYFHKSAAALTPEQAALLAGCLPNPRTMVPGSPNKRLRARQRMILSRLHRWGDLFEREVLTESKPPDSAPAVTATGSPATETATTETAVSTATTGTTGTEGAVPIESTSPAESTATVPATTTTTSTTTTTTTTATSTTTTAPDETTPPP